MKQEIIFLKKENIKVLMSERYKKTYKYLNYTKLLLILISAITSCVSISAFASLVFVPVGAASSAVGIKSSYNHCRNQYKSIIKKKNKKHDKLVLLGKDKLNSIEFLNFKSLIDSYINHDEFDSIKNVWREYN